MNEKLIDFIIFTLAASIMIVVGDLADEFILIIAGFIAAIFALVTIGDIILMAKMKATKKRRDKNGNLHK
jgi:voltage-gated potassium channel Kch